MHSFGLVQQWESGVNHDALFERTCFLAELLSHEEYL